MKSADTSSGPGDGKTLSTQRKTQAGFALALACLGMVGAFSYLSVVRLSENAAWVEHTHDVMSRLDRLLAVAADIETAQRGYVITGNDSYLEPYRHSVQVVDSELNGLRTAVVDNNDQQQRLNALAAIIAERLAGYASAVELRRDQGFEAARASMLMDTGKQLNDPLRSSIAEMKNVEQGLLGERQLQTQRSAVVTRAVIVGGVLIALGFVGWALFFIRRDFSGRQYTQAQLDRFFSLSLDFLCISSADGYFKRVSPAVTDMLGWSVEEFLSQPYIDLVHPEDRAATLREVERQMLAGEKVMQFENRYRHKDGSWRLLSWRSMPQPDGLMYATARDVTELKRTEQLLRDAKELLELRFDERTAELAQANASLRRSERRFRALLEQGSDSISVIAADNKILYLSPSVSAVEGYTPEELLERSGIENTHPDDVPLVRQLVQQLIENPGKPVPVLWRRRHKNGEWIWLEGIATNLLDDPAIGGIVTNYRDVTQRKQAESKLQAQMARLTLLSQITRAIGERQDLQSIFQVVVSTLEEQLPLDFACLCLYDAAANHLVVRSVGVRSEALAMELALTEQARVDIDENGLSQCVRGSLVYEPDLSVVPFAFPQRLTAGGLHSMVVAPLRSENKVFGVLVTARLPANGFSSGECEFLRQLSEHVALAAHQTELYSSLQQAYDDLRQTQQAVMQQERLRVLGQMASGIAHDINNAISPITLYTESLLEREPNLSERARGYLHIIQRAIGDVAETVTRMREFYRQREQQLVLEPVQLNTLTSQVVELTRARWADMPQQRGIVIELRTELAAQLPLIMGVESEIREAMTNLIFNAVDAMPQGGTLTLRTAVAGNDGAQQVHMDVIDTGVGMDESTRQRCLELFFTTKGERGTGLGLSMVYGMVQRHSAEIEIDSKPGSGTRVRLSFAAQCIAMPVQFTPAHVVPAELRILIVDDDPVLLKSLRDTLEGDGCKIVAANGGQDGINAFLSAHQNQQTFDAVITDLGMPYVDGRKVAAEVKMASPSTPVIMLTGWGQRLVIEGDVPTHVDRILSKPPKLLDLRKALAEVTALLQSRNG